MMPEPQPQLDLYATAAADLVGLAYRNVGPNPTRAKVAAELGDLVALAADTAGTLRAAMWAPAEDKPPLTVIGMLDAVDGNILRWHDVDEGRKERQAFIGGDAISRAAAWKAKQILSGGGDRKVFVSYGWVHAKTQQGEGPIRRLYRVAAFPQTSNRPETQQQRREERPAPTGPPPQRQQRHEAPPAAMSSAADEPVDAEVTVPGECVMPDALWAAVAIDCNLADPDAVVSPEDSQTLRNMWAALGGPVRSWTARQLNDLHLIRQATNPGSYRELGLIVDTAVEVFCSAQKQGAD